MSNAHSHSRGDSDAPFSVDPGRKLILRSATLLAIITSVAVAVGWAVNLKLSISAQSDRTLRIEARVNSLESSAHEHTRSLYEQNMALKLMDQKLDYIAGGRRGPAPATSITSP
jgi:hypothetical protein